MIVHNLKYVVTAWGTKDIESLARLLEAAALTIRGGGDGGRIKGEGEWMMARTMTPNAEFRNAASGAPGLDGGVQ